MNRRERRTYRDITEIRWETQTWRAFVTLVCGHRTSFTRSHTAKLAGQHPKKLDCWNCAQEAKKGS